MPPRRRIRPARPDRGRDRAGRFPPVISRPRTTPMVPHDPRACPDSPYKEVRMTTTAPPAPVGTINIVDPSPLNWLFITWNTMEEPIRIDEDGRTVFALAESADWPTEK